MNWHNILIHPEDLWEELIRHKLISGGGGAVLQTVTGISPLTLLNVASKGIESLTQFGKCEQSGTPTPSVPVDIKCNNGALKVRRESGVPLRYQPVEYLVCNKLIEFSGHKTTQNTEMRAKVYIPSSLTAQYLWRSDSGPSITTNTTAYMLTTGGQLRFGDTTILYYATEGEIEIKQNKNGVWINGESIGTYTDISAFQSTAPIGVFSNVTSPNMRIYWVQKYDNGVLDLDLVPVLDTVNNKYGLYDRVGESFYTSTVSGTSFTAGAVINDVEYYVDGTDEVLTVVSETTQTASVEDLLGLGDVADEQDIISGEIARKVGVKILDGTEEWSTDTYGGSRRFVTRNFAKEQLSTVICTHYSSTIEDGARTLPNNAYVAASGALAIYRASTQSIDTVEDWKAYLAGQYANGTPVVIVYPLAEPTTEQVTAQHLTARDTATITAQTNNISNVTLEVQYWQKAE